jgi:hypothetical protein
MSSIGSSDSSNRQDEVVRRNREEAAATEAELVKKQKAEMRRINEKHYAEVEKLKEAHQAQLEAMQKASHDAISERDHRYQQDMEDLRGLHRKALEQSAIENSRREEALRKATSGDIEGAKKRNDERFDRLSKDYNNKLSRAEEVTSKTMEESREAQARAIAENHEKLERAYEKQLSAVKADRDEKVNSLQNQYSDYRYNAEDRLKSQELRHMQAQERSSDSLVRSVRKERQSALDREKLMRDGFDDGLQTQRNRYDKAMKKQAAAQSMVSETLKSNAVDRIDNQVRRLEGEKEDLKEVNARQQLLNKQAKEEEIRHIKEAYGKNIENYREQRDQAVRESNERSARDVAAVRADLGKQLSDSNRSFRDRLNENTQIQTSAYRNATADFEARTQQQQMFADQRVKNIFDTTQEEKTRLIQKQAEDHTTMQHNRADEIKALHAQLESEKQDAVLRMQDQIRKQEVAHTEKMNQLVAKYEKQITALKDQVVREKRNGEENVRRTVDEMTRAHKISIDQLEAKNRDRLRQVNAVQSEELRSLNKRHEEKLDQVLAVVKKT